MVDGNNERRYPEEEDEPLVGEPTEKRETSKETEVLSHKRADHKHQRDMLIIRTVRTFGLIVFGTLLLIWLFDFLFERYSTLSSYIVTGLLSIVASVIGYIVGTQQR